VLFRSPPVENPRYAISVVIEHGGGSGSAYPIARDVMTYLFDREKATSVLEDMEKNWGGGIEQRMAQKMARFKAQKELEKAIAEGRTTQTEPSANDAPSG